MLVYLGAALSSSVKRLCFTRIFSTMASIKRSVSAMLAAGSVLIVILERVSVTNCFPACKQIQLNYWVDELWDLHNKTKFSNWCLSLMPTLKTINRLTPSSDQNATSPNNIHTLSSKQVMRILKLPRKKLSSWSKIKFS